MRGPVMSEWDPVVRAMLKTLIEQVFKGKPRLRGSGHWCITDPMNRRTRYGLCALLLTLPAACTQFPALDSRATPELLASSYPDLVPVEPLLAQAGRTGQTGQTSTNQTETALAARVAALQARAARLRGSVLSGPEKQRLAQGMR